ncbi:uracil-DNA glycosylase, mitochondrial-like [Musa acuminata AAA Group]|uniref:uracil-DNA glycosylase, mitochondrial-like n=1 Tax=Musa acuminata AAA Group TaxID=214697 RepID=UPI0031DD4540
MGDKGEGQNMASSAKNLDELFHPAKRLRPLSPSEPPDALIPHSPVSPLRKASPARRDPAPESAAASVLTPEQKQRIEINKALARSKRNLRISRERVEKAKAEGMDYVKLEELLVEESWLEALPGELQKPYAKNLCRFVERETRGSVPIYPPPYLVFNALHLTPFDQVKVVIIGQDPYHGHGQAMGLAFSVPGGVKIPSSLVNIFKELKEDLGHSVPLHGNLERWAVQGVLLLNAVLTVRDHQANSHAKKGWEPFTDAIIRTISQKKSGVVFLLWGNSAQEKSRLIDGSKHRILRAAHPSGLSANRGFFGCRHFSETNRALEKLGLSPIDWKL